MRYSGFPDPDRWRASKRLGGKRQTSPRDWTAREHDLPWAPCSIPPAWYAVKHARARAPTRTAMALLDRIVDGAIILKIAGKSYRAHRAKPGQAEPIPNN